MYQLAKHPKVQENLYKEVKTVLPSENDKLTVQKLEKMIYLKSVIKETLRFILRFLKSFTLFLSLFFFRCVFVRECACVAWVENVCGCVRACGNRRRWNKRNCSLLRQWRQAAIGVRRRPRPVRPR